MHFPRFHDQNYQDAQKVYLTDRLLAKIILWIIPVSVTPNHITLVRIVATPLTIALLSVENYVWGVPIFLIVAFTDALDGALARTRNMITPWGMLFDPLADKFLIVPVLLVLMYFHLPRLLVLTIVIVELLVFILALFWRNQGRIVQANLWGKMKMILEVTGIMILLIGLWFHLPLVGISSGILIVSIGCALMALFRYGI